VERLPGNTKNRLFTRSWTARVRLVHSWAGLRLVYSLGFHWGYIVTVDAQLFALKTLFFVDKTSQFTTRALHFKILFWTMFKIDPPARWGFATETIRGSPRCCAVLQCVAVCCSVLRCVAVCCSGFAIKMTRGSLRAVLHCSVLPCVAVYCSVV